MLPKNGADSERMPRVTSLFLYFLQDDHVLLQITSHQTSVHVLQRTFHKGTLEQAVLDIIEFKSKCHCCRTRNLSSLLWVAVEMRREHGATAQKTESGDMHG